MSSHHTIRENQEPAVLLLDPNAIDIQVLHDLLEWSPLLIVSEACVDWILMHQIKADGVIVSKEKYGITKEKLRFQEPLKLIKLKNDPFIDGVQHIISTKNLSIHSFMAIDFDMIE